MSRTTADLLPPASRRFGGARNAHLVITASDVIDNVKVARSPLNLPPLSSSSYDRRTPSSSSNFFYDDNQATLSSIDGNDSASMAGVGVAVSSTSATGVVGGARRVRLPGCGSTAIGGSTGGSDYRQSVSDDDSGCALIDEYRYAWVPSGLPVDLIHQYFSSLPQEKIPYVNSAGEKWRFKQLTYQWPPQDSEPRYCRRLDEVERKEMKKFSQQRKNEPFGYGLIKTSHAFVDGQTCNFCVNNIFSGDLFVSIDKKPIKNDHSDIRKKAWHPNCFVCQRCNELLVDLAYFQHEGQVYCGRHYAEIFKPRCIACDELIFADECTEADNKTYHVDHFLCFSCDCPLGGAQYVTRESRPYCLRCFEADFNDPAVDPSSSSSADLCAACHTPISAQDAKLNHSKRCWHATNQCFSCARCRQGLLGRSFFADHTTMGVVYCNRQCADAYDEARRCQPSLSLDATATAAPSAEGGSSGLKSIDNGTGIFSEGSASSKTPPAALRRQTQSMNHQRPLHQTQRTNRKPTSLVPTGRHNVQRAYGSVDSEDDDNDDDAVFSSRREGSCVDERSDVDDDEDDESDYASISPRMERTTVSSTGAGRPNPCTQVGLSTMGQITRGAVVCICEDDDDSLCSHCSAPNIHQDQPTTRQIFKTQRPQCPRTTSLESTNVSFIGTPSIARRGLAVDSPDTRISDEMTKIQKSVHFCAIESDDDEIENERSATQFHSCDDRCETIESAPIVHSIATTSPSRVLPYDLCFNTGNDQSSTSSDDDDDDGFSYTAFHQEHSPSGAFGNSSLVAKGGCFVPRRPIHKNHGSFGSKTLENMKGRNGRRGKKAHSNCIVS